MLFPDRAGFVLPPSRRLRRIPGVRVLPSCPLAIPSDQPAAWEVHAIRLSNLLRAARESRFAQSITGVFRMASLPLRCANCFSREVQLRGYPASTTRWAPLNRSPLRGFRSLLIAGQYLLRVWVRPRAPFRLPSGNRGVPVSSGPQVFPRPQARSSPPRCIGLRERTQLLLKGRVQSRLSCEKCPVSGLSTCPQRTTTRQTAANRMDIALSGGPQRGPLWT